MKKRYIILLIIIGLLVADIVWFFSSPMSVTTDVQTTRFFGRKDLACSIGHDSIWGHPLRWVEVVSLADDPLPIVLFTHGAPGAANNFFQFLADTALLKHARLIAVDRLGYSPDDQGNAEVSIEKQSEALAKVLSHYRYPYVIAVGHSYGGPITASFVLDHPQKVKAAVLLSPALDPDEEKVFFLERFTRWKATRWAIPNFLMTAAAEKQAHEGQLRLMVPKWKLVQTPFVHIHGTADHIVPYGNIAFSRRVVPDTLLRVITVEGGTHMLPWTDSDLVRDELLKLLK